MLQIFSGLLLAFISAGAIAQALPPLELIRSDETITVPSGEPVYRTITSPVIENSDGLVASGPMTVDFTLDAGASNTYIVNGVTVEPGQTKSLSHDFTETDGRLALDVAVDGSGTVSADDYSLEVRFPGAIYWTLESGDSSYLPQAPHFVSDDKVRFLLIGTASDDFFEVEMDVAGNILSHEHYAVTGSPLEPGWKFAQYHGESSQGSVYQLGRGALSFSFGLNNPVDTVYLNNGNLTAKMAQHEAMPGDAGMIDAVTGEGVLCYYRNQDYSTRCLYKTDHADVPIEQVKKVRDGDFQVVRGHYGAFNPRFGWGTMSSSTVLLLDLRNLDILHVYDIADASKLEYGQVVGGHLISRSEKYNGMDTYQRSDGLVAHYNALDLATGEGVRYEVSGPSGDTNFETARSFLISDEYLFHSTEDDRLVVIEMSGSSLVEGRVAKEDLVRDLGGSIWSSWGLEIGNGAYNNGRLLASRTAGTKFAMLNTATEAYFEPLSISETAFSPLDGYFTLPGDTNRAVPGRPVPVDATATDSGTTLPAPVVTHY